MAGYTRQSTFADGDTITAALFNNEFNQLLNAFSNTSGHKHDGTANEGPVIGLIGDAGETSPNNKVLIDTTNNYIEFYVEVSSAPVQQLYIADGAIIPVTDSDIDLGTTSLRFKDTYTDTVTTTGNVSIGGDLTVTGSATISGNLTFGDADTDSINLAAEIDSDIIPNTDGTYDLGSATKEWQDLYIDGTANIDSLVADTADINGGTIDGATIATSDITVGAGKTLDVSAGTLTLADNQISGDKVEGGTIAATTITDLTFGSLNDGTITVTAFADEDDMSSDSATLVPTQQSVKAYVDSQVTAQDLDFQGDTGGALSIDLDSESLTIAGGTGIDTSGATNTLTVAIDSTVATLTGTQTLTNKTLTTPIISSISNTGTLTLPTSTDTLVGRATTDTLTNKTLTSPVINTGVSGTAFLDDDTFATATASTLASSESIKAYVDTTVAATNEVVEDTTPQLGGDLDLNSNDITGTGNINITGTIQSSGNITGTLATAAQPNITSVGTLTGLNVAGTPTFDGLTVDGTATFNTGTGTTNNFIITGTDAGGSTAPDLVLFRDSASPVDGDNIGMLLFKGNNDAGTSIGYAGIFATINDASSTTEDGKLNFSVATANTESPSGGTTFMTIEGGGDISFYEDTGTTAKFFWDASAERLGIGTTSPSSILHLSAANDPIITLTDTGFGASADITGSNGNLRLNSQTATIFDMADSEVVRIDGSGNVGIGTDSPNFKLENTTTADIGNNTEYTTTRYAFGRAATPCYITAFRESFSSTSSIVFHSNSNEGTSPTEKMRITSSGNVGIGTDSPSRKVHIDGGSTDAAIQFTNTNTGSTGSDGTYIGHAGTGTDFQLFNYETGYMRFGTTGLERMRIDSSGNVLVGTTDNNVYNDATGTGTVIQSNGIMQLAANNGTPLYANRQSTDGDIVDFRKNGSTVGSIGTKLSSIYLANGDVSLLPYGNGDTILPRNGTGGSRDAAIDLGDATNRFKDLYLSGTVNAATLNINGGTIKLDGNHPTGTNNVALGDTALDSLTSGTANTAIGSNAGTAITEGRRNVAIGSETLESNTTGENNTAVGQEALEANTTASNNTAVGRQALTANTTGTQNVAVGANTLDANTTGNNNTALGYNTLGVNTTGGSNVAVGYAALDANTTAGSNTAVGAEALTLSTTGASNTAVGRSALGANTTGAENTAVGYAAGDAITTSIHNTLIGSEAGGNMTAGDGRNVCVGRYAGRGITTGDRNVAIGEAAMQNGSCTSADNIGIGVLALYSTTSGSGNVGIGRSAAQSLTTGIGNVGIGYQALDANVSGSYNVAIGQDALGVNTASNNVAIGTNAADNTTSGTNITAIGRSALDANTTGSNNTAVGRDALAANTTGAFNSMLGTGAGDAITTGSNHAGVGYGALTSMTTNGGCSALGYHALQNTTGDTNTGVGEQAGANVTSGTNNLCLGAGSGNSASPSGNILTSSNIIVLGNNSITTSYIKADWTVTSDKRDKTDIEPLTMGLDLVNKLEPVTYKWDMRSDYENGKPDGTHKQEKLHGGLLAQDVEKLEREYGYKVEDETSILTDKNNDGNYGLTYSKFVPVLINAVKELSSQVDELKAEIQNLKGE